MSMVAEKEMEHIGGSKGAADHDHDHDTIHDPASVSMPPCGIPVRDHAGCRTRFAYVLP